MAGLIKLNNTSDIPFVDHFGGVKFSVPARGTELVPDGAMRLWLGDPNARDYPRDRQRHGEFERLQTRYGAGTGMPGDDRDMWNDVKPQLEAYTVDGERIYTVIDDPTGEHAGSGAPVYSQEQLSRLAVEQAALIEQLKFRLDENGLDGDVQLDGTEPGEPGGSGGIAAGPDPLAPIVDQLPPADNPSRIQVTGR